MNKRLLYSAMERKPAWECTLDINQLERLNRDPSASLLSYRGSVDLRNFLRPCARHDDPPFSRVERKVRLRGAQPSPQTARQFHQWTRAMNERQTAGAKQAGRETLPRLKLLITAYACEPMKGSEAAVAWNWIEQASRFCDIWVITRANNRKPIESFLHDRPLPNVSWVYYDLPKWARFWKKGAWGAWVYYYLWQRGVYRVARRLHAQIQFDRTHAVTIGVYWLPTYLCRLPIPFIWGPVGGAESCPHTFYRTMSLGGRFHEHLRDLVRWLLNRHPTVTATARRAHLSLATNEESARLLRELGAPRAEVFSQVALTFQEFERLERLPLRGNRPFRLMSIGRLLESKAIHLGVDAFARLVKSVPEAEYWIIGSGPERSRLEVLAQRLGVASSVHLMGSMPRARVFDMLAECDVLVHPSLHETGTYVCAEAMAAGRPVICLDHGGPGQVVTKEAGIKIVARDPEQTVVAMLDAMLALARSPERRVQLGQAGRERVRREMIWERKGELFHTIYEAEGAGRKNGGAK
jgi:glycosyltransferase involved in cell wall biosynthesis